jgi:hypothetical protein
VRPIWVTGAGLLLAPVGVDAVTTLDGAITAAQTTFDVIDSSDFPSVPFTAQIGAEDITVTAIASETWTALRGINGTIATAHTSGATVQDVGASPPVEIPRSLLTDDMYQNISIKNLTSGLFTSVYYNETFPLGTIKLWPIPTQAINRLVLYSQQAIRGFADLTTQYDFPPGYEDAFEYNLALRLASPYSRDVPGGVAQLAQTSLKMLKRANTPMSDLVVDSMFAENHRQGYNLITGEGG